MTSDRAERMQGTLVIAHLTWMEARRRRIALAAVLCGLLFLLAYGTAVFFMQRHAPEMSAAPPLLRQAQLVFMTLAGLYVVNFLTIALAVLLPVDTLSGEISSGVMQTLASKPIRRADIVRILERLNAVRPHRHIWRMVLRLKVDQCLVKRG